MGERMSDQELMTGVSTKPHKRILAAMNLLEQARSPEGLISAAADTYPYVKAAIITAVRADANKIAELEAERDDFRASYIQTACSVAKLRIKHTALVDGLRKLAEKWLTEDDECDNEYRNGYDDGKEWCASDIRTLLGKESEDAPPTDYCECDNTHEQNHTVCQFCWSKGIRFSKEKDDG